MVHFLRSKLPLDDDFNYGSQYNDAGRCAMELIDSEDFDRLQSFMKPRGDHVCEDYGSFNRRFTEVILEMIERGIDAKIKEMKKI